MTMKAKRLRKLGIAIKYSPMNSIKRAPFNTLSEFGNLERFDKTIMRIHPLRRVTHAPPAPRRPQLLRNTSLENTLTYLTLPQLTQ
ncbi:unnamed protein product, partial [Brenthis ino]